MVDIGRGAPLVLIPGIQGRWEWMAPAIRALAMHHRVLSFSLDEAPERRDVSGVFDAWMDQIDHVLEHAHEPRAIIVGVSFGGLIAARYAARRPDRTAGLVMVSSPSPRIALDPESAGYLHSPRLALPFFAWRACRRLLPETMAARVTWPSRARFLAGHVGRVLRAPLQPSRMAHWVRAWMVTDLEADCRLVTAPTLVITGESHLDRVVPVASTLEVQQYIPAARHEVLRHTGHIGLISRPLEFAALITAFINDCRPATDVAPVNRSG